MGAECAFRQGVGVVPAVIDEGSPRYILPPSFENRCTWLPVLFHPIRKFIVRKARERLWSPGSLLGAPADIDRYQDHVQQQKWDVSRRLFLMWWRARKLSTAAGFPHEKAPPARRILVPANRWVVLQPSTNEEFLAYTKKYKGYEALVMSKEEARSLQEKYILSWNIRYKEKNRSQREVMHFMLHIKAWAHCLESGKSVLVSEYGSPPLTRVPAVRFKHLAVLIAQRQTTLRERDFRFPFMDTPLCYAITPDGANRLITTAGRMLLPSFHSYMEKMFKKLSVVYWPLLSQPIDYEARVLIAGKAPHPLQEAFWDGGDPS